jgi:DegV family protein with EDD domain
LPGRRRLGGHGGGAGGRLSGPAIVTDSAADLPPEVALARGIAVVPLLTTFGSDTYRVGVDLSAAEFWAKLTAPGAPFPTTAASTPAVFEETYAARFAAGADGVVAVHVASTLSATMKSAKIARDALPDKEIIVVDSWSASGGLGLLALLAADLRDRGSSAQHIAETLTRRSGDLRLWVVVDTLEYLRRGGRISGAQAALGTLLSVKPIITIGDGKVEQVDRVRTRGKARERLLELLTAQPVERVFILHGAAPDVEEFATQLRARLPDPLPDDRIVTSLIGASVGTHLGPGCVGAAILLRDTQDATIANSEVPNTP